MSSAPQHAPPMTAEEFARRPDPGYPEKLVKGRVVRMPPPGARHGGICNKVGRLLGNFADDHDLGHVLSNDSGMVTERGPDTVRGPDISYYSYEKIPRGGLPEGYPDVPPDLVAEVLSPDKRWPKVLVKVGEYLSAGVGVVLVLDPDRRSVHLYEGDAPSRVLADADQLELTGVLPGFRVPVRRFFE